MEDNNLNTTPIQAENVVTPPIPVEPQPKNNSVLIILSVFLIVLVGVISFLGYQNWALQKQISLLTATPVPSSTPYVIPTMTTSPSPSVKSSSTPSGTPKACTMEAKLCPNGSYVGRTGPNCEFSICPTP